MTYAELKTRLQTWWESTETNLVTEIDTFINHAELRIHRSVDLNVTRTTDATIVITQDVATVTLPTAVIVLQSVQLLVSNARTFLLPKDKSYLDDYTGNRTTTGTPKYYAWQDETTLLIAPTPDAAAAAGTISIEYTVRPTQLSSSNTETWVSLNAPDVLFYACMLELLTFQKAEQDTITDYSGKYQQALQGFVLEENMRNRTDEYREKEIKMGEQ
jgi:hypothetical protein